MRELSPAARRAALLCPVHDMTDCSPLLNGCSIPAQRWAAVEAVLPLLTVQDVPHVAAQALRDVADKWQRGEWANAPRCADRVQERIANGQYVLDWLRDRANHLEQEEADRG